MVAAAEGPSGPFDLPFDDTCPHCKRSSDLGEVFEGVDYRCKQCRKRVFTCVVGGVFGDPERIMLGDGETYPATPGPRLVGRARTRARWRRQGRR